MAAQLGAEARRVRRAAGVRMVDIASAVGVSEATVSHFERGRAWSPHTDELLDAYARLCGTTKRELIVAAARGLPDG